MLDLKTEVIIRQAEREALEVQRRRFTPIYVAIAEAERSNEGRNRHAYAALVREWVLRESGEFLVAVGTWLTKRAGTVVAS